MNDIMPQQSPEIKKLLEKATLLKKEENVTEAIDNLRQAYKKIVKTKSDFGLATFLRLPMYLQESGKIKEAWTELNKLLKEGYPNQPHNSDYMAHIRADIYHKMYVFLQRENKIEYAIVYLIFFYLSRMTAFYLQDRKEDTNYVQNHKPHEENLLKLLRKLDKEELLTKINKEADTVLHDLPNIDFNKTEEKILQVLCPNSRCTLILEDREVLTRPPRIEIINANLSDKKLPSRISQPLKTELYIDGIKYRIKKVTNVPAWNDYFPNLTNATLQQKKFYDRWLKNYQRKVVLDINSNLSYVFIYLYSVIDEFKKKRKIEGLIEKFNIIGKVYANYEKIQGYLDSWIYEAHLYLEDYDTAWDYARKTWKIGGGGSNGIANIVNIRSKCCDTSINGQDMLATLGQNHGLTPFGQEKYKQIIELATIFLDNFHRKESKNYIEHFIRKFDFSKLSNNDYIILKAYYSSEKDFIFWKESYERERSKYPYIYHTQHFDKIVKEEAIPHIISIAAENALKLILRECENTLREEQNLPRVGEGWVSETILFHKLREAFPNENIIHHGRPHWLDPQHLDIYFVDKNIALEYQGPQHDDPTEYFGGEKAFKEQQKRDIRKKRLCEKNSCTLIYVRDGYRFEEIVNIIKKLLQKNSIH